MNNNIINLDIKINGMSVARYIAANILTDVEHEDEEYYEIEDKLTSIIEKSFTNILTGEINYE